MDGLPLTERTGAPYSSRTDAMHVPANFTFIGNGMAGRPGGVPLHGHDYDFNDAILPIGISYCQTLATRS